MVACTCTSTFSKVAKSSTFDNTEGFTIIFVWQTYYKTYQCMQQNAEWRSSQKCPHSRHSLQNCRDQNHRWRQLLADISFSPAAIQQPSSQTAAASLFWKQGKTVYRSSLVLNGRNYAAIWYNVTCKKLSFYQSWQMATSCFQKTHELTINRLTIHIYTRLLLCQIWPHRLLGTT